ncbi:VRR-NUC domain-containing protein [Bordetella genomosp. 9]|uniref:VRR-NUC domain-containing protein n=1 Tax=Bordetella genomosp. 9 TaxID=1416803 RepID=UPI00211B1BD4|nr:VRR-NUC domain-containing protein [Bordetella genomosp. 9]
MPAAILPRLDPGSPDIRYYYLRNFRFALDWILARYDDVLGEEERGFIAAFAAMPRPAQALMTRMLMRRGPVFRGSTLRYDEIGCPVAASRDLVAQGWVNDAPVLPLEDAARLLRRAELLRLLPADMRRPALSKAGMVEWLRLNAASPRAWTEWDDSGDFAIGIRVAPLIDRLRLMFFGNLRQAWSEFIVADLGIVQYERVAFPDSARAFHTRADVDAYLWLHERRQRLEDGTQSAAALLEEILPASFVSPWLRHRHAKLRFLIGRQLERQADWDLACRAYDGCGHPEARQRYARVLELQERHAEALRFALQATRAPLNETEAQSLARLVARQERRLGLPRAREPAARDIPVDVLTLPHPAQPRAVEHIVREHLDAPQAPAFYVENTLINSLFGLLCWEAVFQPLPGAFFHPFQRGPADLHAPDFHARRGDAFGARLARLDDGSYKRAILATFEAKMGIQSPFVFWGALDHALLALALDCIPVAHLKAWFTRILRDVASNTSGLPDLIRFFPARHAYELVEVKGPGDRLQDNQRRWMAYNAAHGVPVRVCRVRWLSPPA